jgi:serine/threonine-protein kinase RsbW
VSTVPGVHGVIGLRVPGAIAYRNLAIRVVSTACKMALETNLAGAHGEADGDFEAEVVSAFGEAFNNIAVHGFRDLPPQSVQIEVDWDDEKISITFVDNGHIYDPALVAAPDLDELPEHGMGLFIIRSCMDRVDYQPGPPNVLRLVKLRTRSRWGVPPPPPTSSEQAVQVGHPGERPGAFSDHPGERPGAFSDHPGERPGAFSDHPGERPRAFSDHPGERPGAFSDGLAQGPFAALADVEDRSSGVDLIPPINLGAPAAARMAESSRRR